MSADLVGVWRLVSCELRRTDGQVWALYDTGYVIYSAEGYMAVALMQSDRSTFASGDLRVGTIEEKVAAYDSFISYAGKYEKKGNDLYHHVEICSFPNFVGVTLERNVKVEGERLTVSSTPTLINGQEQTASLIFERVS